MKILSAVILVFVIICSGALLFYDIQFDAAGCDIFFCRKGDPGVGYGVNYRKEFRFFKVPAAGTGVTPEEEDFSIPQVEKIKTEGRTPFPVGEKLFFDVQYKGMKLGESVLTFHGERRIGEKDLYYITFHTELLAFEDREEIYAYKDTFLPFLISRDIKRMGALPLEILEEYDQDAFRVKIRKKSPFLTERFTIEKKGPIHNAVLLTYFYRTKPRIEDSHRESYFLPKAEFDLVLKEKKEVNTKIGRRTAYIFKGEPSNFKFWLSAGERRLPLKIDGHNILGYTFIIRSVAGAGTQDS
jgi:hypothetical protein